MSIRRRIAVAAALSLGCAREQPAAYRYFYQDVFKPYFTLDRASGLYRPTREGGSARAFEASKPANVLRIFLVGGSIAQMYHGENDLVPTLERATPGRRVEFINCGMAGYDSPREQLLVREVLNYQPDAVILMSGHNETLTLPWVPRWKLQTNEFLQKFARSWATKSIRISPFASAGVVRGRLDEFERRVRDMARACAARRVPLVIFVPPLNAHGPSSAPLPSKPDFVEGWLEYLAGDCRSARLAWQRPEALADGGAAHAAFFSGLCMELKGRRRQANAQYLNALREEQPLLGRCGPACRAALERAAAQPGAVLADGAAQFDAYAAPNLPGYDEFIDSVHWRPAMQFLVTRALLGALARASLAPESAASVPAATPSHRALRSERGWLSLLRVAASSIQMNESGMDCAVAIAILDYAQRRGRADLDSPRLLKDLVAGAEMKGRAWGMEKLSIDRAAWQRHLGIASLIDGRLRQARAYFAASVRAGGGAGSEFLGLLASARLSRRPERLREVLSRGKTGGAAAPIGMISPGSTLSARDARRRARALESSIPTDPAARDIAAQIYFRLGDRAGVRRVLCFPPAQAVRCARACLDVGDKACARAQARRALDDAPDAQGRREAALVLQDSGDSARSLPILAAAAAAAPNDAGAQLDYGVGLFMAGRLDEAIGVLRRCAELEASPGDCVLSLATALNAAGRRTQAAQMLRGARPRAFGENAARIDQALREQSKP